MKNHIGLFLILQLLCLSSPVFSQVFPVDTIQYKGDPAKRINLVILGDGFQANELQAFDQAAQNFSTALFQERPFAEYVNYFNVFSIRVPSVESGADHPANATDVTEPVFPMADVNTAFGASFDAYGIHRLLVPFDVNLINTVLATNFPNYDQVVVLVNSPEYGGNGGLGSMESVFTNTVVVATPHRGTIPTKTAKWEYWATIFALFV